VTYAAIQALQPDLIINAGTAGGFKVCPSLSCLNCKFNYFQNVTGLLVFDFLSFFHC
jgi:hypothetical protein